MKVVLFDLGDTLAAGADSLLPGALETLEAVRQMSDETGHPPVLALVSDFTTASSAAQVPAIEQEYFNILEHLGIREFFEPVSQRVTLSTRIGVRKPNKKIFAAAVKRAGGGPGFARAIFITENVEHVAKARLLGLRSVHVKGPNQPSGEVESLAELVPVIRQFVEGHP